MVTVGELYSNVKSVLKLIGLDSYSFEAKCIMEKAFDSELPRILTKRNSAVPENIIQNIQNMMEQRKKGYPLQYILGEWEFYGYPFKVGEGVLIPRQDTETVIDYVLEKCYHNNQKTPKIFDLCSGSGCIAVTLKKELPDADISAVELSDKALEYLKKNAVLNNADINIFRLDVLKEQNLLNNADIIVSNPPYLDALDMSDLQSEVAFEPHEALDGGYDGLIYYREITRIWRNYLKPNGIIVYEIGMNQHDDVADILKLNNFNDIEFKKDTGGIIRVVSAKKEKI